MAKYKCTKCGSISIYRIKECPFCGCKEIEDITSRRENRKSVLKLLLITFVLYTAVTCMIMRFAHPEYTETELFLNLPKALILNFK